MQKIILVALICVPSAVFGMKKQDATPANQLRAFEKQKAELAVKLKLVLTAGSCVYREHQAIHSDVIKRSQKISALLQKKEYEQLAAEVDEYAQMLGTVAEVYNAHALKKDTLVVEHLETSHRNCLNWALSLASASKCTIAQDCLSKFSKAFIAKNGKAANLYKKAGDRQNAFEWGIERSVVLPIEQAVTAWCVELSSPILIEAGNDASSERSLSSPGKEELNGLFESFYGDLE